MLRCPHCGKKVFDRLVVEYAGRIGGKKTAKRGSEYFRWLQSQRKNKRGGRPKKTK